MMNNAVKYADPSGHKACVEEPNGRCELDPDWHPRSNKGSATDVPSDPLELTYYGRGQQQLFDLFLTTAGWWQDIISSGVDPLVLFVTIMLSIETKSLRIENALGWDDGNKEGRKFFHRATAGAFWMWTQNGQGVPKSSSPNAIFNWLGAFSGSAQLVFENSLGPTGDVDPQYRELSDKERLNKLMRQDQSFDPAMISMVADIFFDAPDPSWQQGGAMPTWGNKGPGNYPRHKSVWSYDTFHIYMPK